MSDLSLQHHIENASTISYLELAENYPALKIENATASAVIALHGAHLISYTPQGQEPVIFTSEQAIYKEGKAIRGGIPVCWPWFGAHPENPDFPAHGFARNRFWQLESIDESPQATALTFTLPITSADEQFIGGKASLILTLTIGTQLKVELTTTNLGDNEIQIGGALHSYFTISAIHTAEISGLEETTRLNSLTGETLTNPSTITFDQEYDSIFLNTPATNEIHDPGFNRTIIVEKSGSLATTVWNPWIEKSKGMGDLGNEDYHTFLCIEAINWREDLRTLQPTEAHTLSQTIYLK